MIGRAAAISALAWALAGCRMDQTLVTPDPHLERMLKQPKAMPYGEAPVLPHDMTMQPPPGGVVPVDAPARASVSGVAGGRWVDHIPVPVDRRLVETGRARFETFCAACHGIQGDAVSIVAEKMDLRKPENLVGARVRSLPPGQIFETIRQGYGLMPSYADQISIEDAWGVVAYVRALQIAAGTPVSDLPLDVKAELMKEAP